MPNEIQDGQTCYAKPNPTTPFFFQKPCNEESFCLDIFQSLRKDYRARSIYLHSPILSPHRSGASHIQLDVLKAHLELKANNRLANMQRPFVHADWAAWH